MLVATALYTTSYQSSTQVASVLPAVLVNLTNGDRAADKLNSLSTNAQLTAAAQAKANDMAAKGYFAHNSPGGQTPWTWMSNAGYSFVDAGENLAVDFTDSTDVEHAWMNSPEHRANILNSNFTEVGIATAQGMYQGHMVTFVVQMFGRPASKTAAAQPIVSKTVAPEEMAVATTRVLGADAYVKPAATTTNATTTVPAVANPSASVPPAPFWGFFATTPRLFLRAGYLAFAFLLLLALGFTTRSELKKHHMKHVYAVLVLLMFMGGLFLFANQFIFTNPIIV